MMLPKQIIRSVILATTLGMQVISRADDSQSAMHALVERYPFGVTKGAQWETDKKTLTSYNQEQLVRALIAEIDLDRGSPIKNKDRDIAAYILFRALDLPPTLICQELDKPSSPERKASLMFVLRHANKPEVVQALLRQVGDRRTVNDLEMTALEAGMKTHPFRVCDQAYNALVVTVDAPNLKTSPYGSDVSRDKDIKEGLARLNLTTPR